MADKRFDQEIRQWFEDFKVDYQPQHWDMMQQRLDALSLDQDSAFDDAISERFANFQASQVHPDWSRMENLLDEKESLTDDDFDKEIAEQLVKVQPPYSPEYWYRIEDMRVNRRNRLIQFGLARTAEIMMLFLLWFNWPAGSIETPRPLPDLDYAVERASSIEVFSDIDKEGISKEEFAAVTEFMTSKSVSNAPVAVSEIMIPKRVSQVPVTGSEVVHPADVNHLEDRGIFPGIPDRSIPALSRLEQLPIFGLGEKSRASLQANRLLAALPGLQNSTLLVRQEDVPEYDHRDNERKISFSPYIAADFNAINSYLGIEKLEDNRLRHLTLTPGVGLGVGFHNGKWSVHTGAGYSYKFYDPNITEQFGSINGYSELNFNKVALHVLQLPIRLQYKLREGMKTTFYMTGGASLHYIVRQEFEKPKRPISSIESIPNPVRPIFEEEQYKSGNFLGRFSEASYLTADLGFGMEYKLNNDLAMYIQPTYMRMFGQGVGPNYDVIHSVSLQVGLRL